MLMTVISQVERTTFKPMPLTSVNVKQGKSIREQDKLNLRVFFRQYPSRHRRENPDKANHCADEDGHGKRDVADFVQIGFLSTI